jgi:hypothetical protein
MVERFPTIPETWDLIPITTKEQQQQQQNKTIKI